MSVRAKLAKANGARWPTHFSAAAAVKQAALAPRPNQLYDSDDDDDDDQANVCKTGKLL